jgi:hypothetical protein
VDWASSSSGATATAATVVLRLRGSSSDFPVIEALERDMEE